MSKKRNADSSEIEKRLQAQNALAAESFTEREAVLVNEPAVDNNNQAWLPLNVLDTIEIF